jgi:hypothetical protein
VPHGCPLAPSIFGDQFSDLKGGHADRTFKMPDPNYFLP